MRARRRVPPAGVNFSAFETRLSTTCPMRSRSPFARGSDSVEHVSEMPRAAATGAPACTACATTAATSSSAFSSARLPALACAVSSRSSTSRSRRSALRSITSSQLSCALGQLGHHVVLQQQLEIAADRCQRRAKLVRDERDELVLHAVELAEPFVLLLRLREQRLAVALRLLARRHVDGEALRVPRVAGLVVHDGVAVLQPDDAPVGGDEPVLELERLGALPCLALRLAHAVAVIGVEVLDEEGRVRVPLLEAVAEDLLDLRAHVRRGLVGRVRRVDVRDQRQLLDERSIALFRLLARRDVDEEALPVEAPSRASRTVTARSCTQTTLPFLWYSRYSASYGAISRLRARDRARARARGRADAASPRRGADWPATLRASSRAGRRSPG